MTAGTSPRPGSAVSADGTRIGYLSLGAGPGIVIVGGVLSTASSYLALARALATHYTVHVMNRRGRDTSGPQRPNHSIAEECADLIAVAQSTRAAAAFGHSFGGLVVLETARRQPAFDQLFVYEPGVPLRGGFDRAWLDGYERLLQAGDRRGAFAWMVKGAGFAPRPLAGMPLWSVKVILRLAIRSRRWAALAPLLETNLVEHRLLAGLDTPSAARFSKITASTTLIAGTKSPDEIGQQLLDELAEAIPRAAVEILPGLNHLAPEEQPETIANAILTHRQVHAW